MNMTNSDDEDDDLAIMRKQYEQRLADEAAGTVQAIASTALPTPPKSPSVTITSDDIEDGTNSTSNPVSSKKPEPLSVELSLSLDPKPQESVSSKKHEPLSMEPADDGLSVLSSEEDELEEDEPEEPEPLKPKSKRGCGHKTVVKPPKKKTKATPRKRK